MVQGQGVACSLIKPRAVREVSKHPFPHRTGGQPTSSRRTGATSVTRVCFRIPQPTAALLSQNPSIVALGTPNRVTHWHFGNDSSGPCRLRSRVGSHYSKTPPVRQYLKHCSSTSKLPSSTVKLITSAGPDLRRRVRRVHQDSRISPASRTTRENTAMGQRSNTATHFSPVSAISLPDPQGMMGKKPQTGRICVIFRGVILKSGLHNLTRNFPPLPAGLGRAY